MSRIHPNNFKTSLAADCSNVATSITLSANLPTIAAGEWIILTLTDNTNYELMKISSNSGAPTYAIVSRGLEGTSAQSWVTGQQVSIRLTKGSVDDKQDVLSGASLSTATVATDDKVIIQDTSDSNNIKTVTTQAIANLAPPGVWTLVTSKTANNTTTTLDFTDLPTSVCLMFVVTSLSVATDNAQLQIRTSNGTGGSPTFDTGGSDYTYGLHGISTATHTADANSTNDRIVCMASGAGTGIGNASGESVNGIIYVFNPTGTTTWAIFRGFLSYINQDDLPATYDFTGARKANSAVNAVRFLTSSGNWNAGTIYCYKLA